MIITNKQHLFKSEKSFYRIPAIIQTKNGTVVACADKRLFSSNDNPNRIDKVIKLSHDNGITWSDEITIIEEYGDATNASAAIDPQLLYNKKTDTIFLLYLHSPMGVGFFGSKIGKGFKKGKKILTDKEGNLYYVKGKNIYDKDDNKIDLTINEQGILSNGDIIYLDNNSLMEFKTSYLMISKSKDNGKTWSKPECINESAKEDFWGFSGAGPGVGLVIKKGKYKGRLLFPIYYSYQNDKDEMKVLSCMVYSDDNGKTFKHGKSPELLEGHYETFQSDFLTESQIVEVGENHLMLFQRNHHPSKKIITYESFDGGITFANGKLHDNLPQPISQIAAINFTRKDQNVVALVNPSHSQHRKNGMLRLSFDGGKTFEKELLLLNDEEAYFGYASIVYLQDDTLGVFFEETESFKNLTFLKINLKVFLD